MSGQDILTLVIACCCLVGVVGLLIPTFISLFKKTKEIIKNKDWMTVMQVAQAAIVEIEEYAKSHPSMTSEEKLEMAIESVKASLTAMGVEFDSENLDKLKEYINSIIKVTKKVNVNETKEIEVKE